MFRFSIMAQIKGNILVPFHGYLPTAAGKNSCAHWMFMAEILHCDDKVRDQLYNETTEVIREKRFDGIILDNSDLFHPDTKKYYRRQGRVFDNKDVFWPVTGMKTRPEFIYSQSLAASLTQNRLRAILPCQIHETCRRHRRFLPLDPGHRVFF